MTTGPAEVPERLPLGVIVREWGRIGITGFGGPPAHIALLRKLCVDNNPWLSAKDFEDGIAAVNLLPGPASTQLAIFCAWRLAGVSGAVLGGVCFIIPGLIVILALSALFLASHPPLWIEAAAAGAGSAVPAVAVQAAFGLVPASWRRAGGERQKQIRWVLYCLAGGAAAVLIGPFLVFVLIACGLVELGIALAREGTNPPALGLLPIAVVPGLVVGGISSIIWVAFKIGALSYGGGFVIIPLMQHDAVTVFHWMTGAQFLDAVALGQITPGPVVQTVAVVGYAAAGVKGALLAALVAFTPSFVFVLVGGPYFDRLRHSRPVQSFLSGAGAGSIGAIAGSAISLGLALSHQWQAGLLAIVLVWLVVLKKSVVLGLLGAAAVGVVAVLAGAPVLH